MKITPELAEDIADLSRLHDARRRDPNNLGVKSRYVEIRRRVPRVLVNIFDSRRLLGRRAFAPLMAGTCGACFGAQPIARQSELEAGERLVTCHACGVVLFDPLLAGRNGMNLPRMRTLLNATARYCSSFALGGIVGDIVGSVFKGSAWQTKQFPLFSPSSAFTDETVLIAATAKALLSGRPYGEVYRRFARRFPDAGYASSFAQWVSATDEVFIHGSDSGAAIRVSPVGWTTSSLKETLDEARRSAQATHDDPESIEGAQAVAAAVFLARAGKSKVELRQILERTFGYDLRRSLAEVRSAGPLKGGVTGAVSAGIIAFLESGDFKDAIRNAVSLGGESDTHACIAGAIAHAFYREVPTELVTPVISLLPTEILRVLGAFTKHLGG